MADYGALPAQDVFMNGGRQFQRWFDSARAPEASEYVADLRQPDSFTRGLLETMDHMVSMQVAAAAGDIEAAREHYNAQRDFFANNQDKVREAYTLNPRGDKFLSSIQGMAELGVTRQYDKVELTIPGQQDKVLAGVMFGPNGLHDKYRAEQLTAANFTDPVVKLLTSGDDELPDATRALKGVVNSVVDPVVAAGARAGVTRVPNTGQHAALADYLATNGGEDVEALGLDAVRALVSSTLSDHMEDGLAVSTYKWASQALRARKTAADARGVQFQAAQEAYALLNSFNGLARAMSPRMGRPSDKVMRWADMATLSLVAEDPEVKLDDPGIKQGVLEMSDVFAQAERAGVRLLPLVQAYGGKIGKAVAGYAISRRQNLPPPPANLMTDIAGLHSLTQSLVTAGWRQVGSSARADPSLEVGEASGVFRATSGSDGLDNAGIALYRALMRNSVQGVVDGLGPRDALLATLNDSVKRGDIAEELADATGLTPEAASGVVAEFAAAATDSGSGAVSRIGLERALAKYAFAAPTLINYGDGPQREMVARWYAANVGAQGKYYDQLIDESGWAQLYRDPILGYGDQEQGRRVAMESSARSQIRDSLHSAVEAGHSPIPVMKHWARQGRFYYVAGFRTEDGTSVPLQDVKYEEKKTAGGGVSRKVLDQGLIPVIEEGYGDLAKVTQEWELPGDYSRIPVVGAGLFTRDPRVFRNAMLVMKKVSDAQLAAMAKASVQVVSPDEM